MNKAIDSHHWIDRTLYPFKSNYIQLDSGEMHYVDEGRGDILLFVHGTPTWSFLYREFIKKLSLNYRCIAVDHLGFGLSENPTHFSGTPQEHAKNLSEFIAKKNLQNITLVVHDFGGPIGLSTAIKSPERIEKLILFNTWLWETKNNTGVLKIDKLINSTLGRFLYLRLNFSPKVLLKKGFSDQNKLIQKIHRHYTKPFPNKAARVPLLNIAKALLGSSDWYQNQWDNLGILTKKEWLILWGTKDEFITTEYLDKWTDRLPQATVKNFECGHFIQEENPKEAINEIARFMHM